MNRAQRRKRLFAHVAESNAERDALRKFVERIARLRTSEEFGEDQPHSDDWVVTLSQLIGTARRLLQRPR